MSKCSKCGDDLVGCEGCRCPMIARCVVLEDGKQCSSDTLPDRAYCEAHIYRSAYDYKPKLNGNISKADAERLHGLGIRWD